MDRKRWPKVDPGRRVGWTRSRKQETSDVLINKKLLSAFHNVNSFPLKRIIIQYWRPVKTASGKRLLTCTGNPYATSFVNQRLLKYRSLCTKFYYAIDEAEDPMIINGAPPARAFKNLFPQVVLDLSLHRGTPLVDAALGSELTCFVMLPVFDGITPVGVVEVSTRLPAHLLVIFNELRPQLKGAGLGVSPPHALMHPCKAISGSLNLAQSELVGNALRAAVESHAITLAQVWAPYESTNGQMLLGKLSTCSIDDSVIKRFYRELPYLPYQKGAGLVTRTLQTRQPHLCRNVYKWSDNKGVLALLSANAKCTCFVICLRSSHTGELDYAFEFFWPQSRDHLALMEALLLTLKEHLPSFKYASGAQLGDELLVLDVLNSCSPFKIFPSETSGMEIKGQSQLTNTNSPEDGNDDLTILALYKVDCRLFFLPSSTTFKRLMEKIKQELQLSPAGTYKIEYQVLPGEWYGLTDRTCLKTCISSYQASKDTDHIKLHVLAVDN